jgi:hypothetical protein
MSDIEFFWPRAWLCVFGLVLSIILVAVTNTAPARETKPAPVPPDWMKPWLALWQVHFGTHITRPGGVTREAQP